MVDGADSTPKSPAVRVPFRLRYQPSDHPTEAVLVEPAEPEDEPPVTVAVAVSLSLTVGSHPLPSVHRVADGLLVVLATGREGPLPNWAALAADGHEHLDGFSGPKPVGRTVLITRLRRLAGNLLLPVNAELIPGLLSDEAADLTAGRGLVLRPAEPAVRALEFDPLRPLEWRELLKARLARQQRWRRLPARPVLADRLRDIVVDRPPPSVKDILEAGRYSSAPSTGTIGPVSSPGKVPTQPASADSAGTPVAGSVPPSLAGASATDSPSKPSVGEEKGWLGRIGSGFARGLQLLGDMLSPLGGGGFGTGSSGSLVESSADRRTLQDRALQELLERFRSGDIETALRNALPLGPSGGRGKRAAPAAQLPNQDPRWSLTAALTTGASAGPVAVWITSAELHAALTTEYRKVAEAAAQAGDARRAAFVYGQLLGDYRRAAEVLASSGLFFDAGMLYQEKCEEPITAAQCFEKAGRTDLALQIYRSCHEHLAAAQLLHRIGDLEAALTEYQRAADKRAEQDQFLAAATLMSDHARRPDLAVAYYQRGWSARPASDALACALQLANLYWAQELGRCPSDGTASHEDHIPNADSARYKSGSDLSVHDASVREKSLLCPSGHTQAFWELLHEADEHYAHPGRESAATEFYNHIARLAGRTPDTKRADDLRDRALLGLAGQLRLRAESLGNAGSALEVLPGSAGWSTAQAADAAQAYRSAVAHRSHASRAAGVRVTALHSARGDITAAARASDSDELILGFSSGLVYCVRPSLETTRPVGEHRLPVRAVATSPAAETVAVLCDGRPPYQQLLLYKRKGTRTVFDANDGAGLLLESRQPTTLSPLVLTGVDKPVCCWNGRQLLFVGHGFLPVCERYTPVGVTPATLDITDDIPVSPTASSLTGLYDSVGQPSGAGLSERPRRHDESDDDGDVGTDSAEMAVVPMSTDFAFCGPTAPVLALSLNQSPTTTWAALLLHGSQLVLALPPMQPWLTVKLPWSPSPNYSPSLLPVERDRVELASIDTQGRLGWAALEYGADALQLGGTAVSRSDSPYLAVAVLSPGRLVGVRASGLDWLRVSHRTGEPRFELAGRTPFAVGPVVAAFPAQQTGGVVVVRRNATLLQAHWPG